LRGGGGGRSQEGRAEREEGCVEGKAKKAGKRGRRGGVPLRYPQ